MKHLLVLIVLLAVGSAGAQMPEPSPSPDLVFMDAGDYQIKFWEEPECPEGWGQIIIKVPPAYGYETVAVECGLVVEEGDD